MIKSINNKERNKTNIQHGKQQEKEEEEDGMANKKT